MLKNHLFVSIIYIFLTCAQNKLVKRVDITEAPWMATVWDDDGFVGTAIIINNDTLVMPASALIDLTLICLINGRWTIRIGGNDPERSQDHYNGRYIIHENHTGGINDIVVLKLAEQITFGPYVSPAEIGDRNFAPNSVFNGSIYSWNSRNCHNTTPAVGIFRTYIGIMSHKSCKLLKRRPIYLNVERRNLDARGIFCFNKNEQPENFCIKIPGTPLFYGSKLIGMLTGFDVAVGGEFLDLTLYKNWILTVD